VTNCFQATQKAKLCLEIIVVIYTITAALPSRMIFPWHVSLVSVETNSTVICPLWYSLLNLICKTSGKRATLRVSKTTRSMRQRNAFYIVHLVLLTGKYLEYRPTDETESSQRSIDPQMKQQPVSGV